MKIKLDENIPFRLRKILTSLGHDVHTVGDEGLSAADDDAVWRAAQQEQRFFITQDFDFSDVRRFAPGTHHGLLFVHLRSPQRLKVAARIEWAFRTHDVEKWDGCFVVLSDSKVRVRPAAP